MVSDVIEIKIQIMNDMLDEDGKTEIIISNLIDLIEILENTNEIHKLVGYDDESKIEYVHFENQGG